MDTIGKIKEEIARLQNKTMDEFSNFKSSYDEGVFDGLEVAEALLDFIEQPVKGFVWKPITEIPTEHYEKNDALSPLYLVRCGEKDGVSIIGYSHYSYATNEWIDCFEATEPGVHKVTEWIDVLI